MPFNVVLDRASDRAKLVVAAIGVLFVKGLITLATWLYEFFPYAPTLPCFELS